MKNKWKIPLICGVSLIFVVLCGVFGVQSFQNRAISLEESVKTADSDINVQEKRRISKGDTYYR